MAAPLTREGGPLETRSLPPPNTMVEAAQRILRLIPEPVSREEIPAGKSVADWNHLLKGTLVARLEGRIQRLDAMDRSLQIKKGISTLFLIATTASFLYFMAAPFFTTLSRQLNYALIFGPILPMFIMYSFDQQVEEAEKERKALVKGIYTLNALCEGDNRHSQVAGHLPGFDMRVAYHHHIKDQLDDETPLSTAVIPEPAGLAGKMMATALTMGMDRSRMESRWRDLRYRMKAAKENPAYTAATFEGFRQEAYQITNPLAPLRWTAGLDTISQSTYEEWILQECLQVDLLKKAIENRCGVVPEAVQREMDRVYGMLKPASTPLTQADVFRILTEVQRLKVDMKDHLSKIPKTLAMRKEDLTSNYLLFCREYCIKHYPARSGEVELLERELVEATTVATLDSIELKIAEKFLEFHSRLAIHVPKKNPKLTPSGQRMEAIIHTRLRTLGIKCQQWEYKRGKILTFILGIALIVFSAIFANHPVMSKWLRIAPLALIAPPYFLRRQLTAWKKEITVLRMAEKLLYNPQEIHRLPAYPNLEAYRERVRPSALAYDRECAVYKDALQKYEEEVESRPLKNFLFRSYDQLGIDRPPSVPSLCPRPPSPQPTETIFSFEDLLYMGEVVTQ